MVPEIDRDVLAYDNEVTASRFASVVGPVKSFDAILNAVVMELQRTQGASLLGSKSSIDFRRFGEVLPS